MSRAGRVQVRVCLRDRHTGREAVIKRHMDGDVAADEWYLDKRIRLMCLRAKLRFIDLHGTVRLASAKWKVQIDGANVTEAYAPTDASGTITP